MPKIYCEEIAEEILFVFRDGDSNPGFSSNKRTHYLLDHGDSIIKIIIIKIKKKLGLRKITYGLTETTHPLRMTVRCGLWNGGIIGRMWSNHPLNLLQLFWNA